MSTISCTTVVLAEDPSERTKAMAVGGFLAGYSGATRTSYATDLRVFATWCRQPDLSLLTVNRSHLERSAGGWKRPAACDPPSPAGCPPWPASTATANRSSWSIAILPQRGSTQGRLRVPHPWPRPNELGAFLVQAGLGSQRDHALASAGRHTCGAPPRQARGHSAGASGPTVLYLGAERRITRRRTHREWRCAS